MPEDRQRSRPLDDVLRIEAVAETTFRAELPGFGGVTLGCATRAAARTVADRALHSLHMYFLRPVPPGAIAELAVERLRDGRRFSHRRVQVRIDDRVLCELVASFTAGGAGVEYQEAVIDPATPSPDELTSEDELARAEGIRRDEPGPIGGALEWRWIGVPWRDAPAGTRSRYRGWVRPRFPLPNDRAMGAAALAFLSDYHSHFPVARQLGGPFEPFGYTSLDQLVWLHRDRHWDDWWLVSSDSDIVHGGRAFTRRLVHARDGQLIASMAQELLHPDPSRAD